MRQFMRQTIAACACAALAGCATARVSEAQKAAEATRIAEEAKVAEAARIAEELRKAEEARAAEEAKIAEARRIAQEAADAAAAKALAERMARTKRVYGIGYRLIKAVPLDPVKNERFCGFLVAPLDATVAKMYGLTAAPQSVVVFGVIPGSAVDRAGIKEKDIVESIDGHPVTIENFDRSVSALIAGQTYQVAVRRDGAPVTLPLVPEVVRMYVPFSADESKDVSVYASPDGVTVTYGFLDFVKDDDELACAMAHELAHLVRGQTLKDSGIGLFSRILAVAIAQAKAPAAQPAPVPAMQAATATDAPAAAVPPVSVAPAADAQAGDATAKVPAAAADPASPAQPAAAAPETAPAPQQPAAPQATGGIEPEADLFGVVYAQAAGFDAELGAVVWERFATSFSQQLGTSYIGVTHPTSAERLARVREIAAKIKAGTFDENAYLAKNAS